MKSFYVVSGAVLSALVVTLGGCVWGENGDDGNGSLPGGGQWSFEDDESLGLSPCAPEAIAYQYFLPAIPEGVLDESCPLRREEVRSYPTYSPSETRVSEWEWEGDVLLKRERRNGRLQDEQRFEFNEDGELKEVSARSPLDSSGAVAQRWSFDDEGRLVLYSRVPTSSTYGLPLKVEQFWEGERLLRRVEKRGTGLSAEVWEYQWSYDEQGRMTGARLVAPDGAEDLARFEYDSVGRLSSAVRFVDGKSVEELSWEFDADHRLRGRSVSSGLHAEESQYLRMPAALVTLHLNRHANAHLAADGSSRCFELPATLGHGYPADEDAYRLGFGEDDEGYSLAYLYGFQGYYVVNSENDGYGHLGMNSGTDPYHSHRRLVEAELRYDKEGRMISETMLVGSLASELEPVSLSRAREFGPQGMVSDTLEVLGDEDSVTAALYFERDGSGNLKERRRLLDGEVLSRQSWGFDGQARPVEVEVHAAQIDWSQTDYVHYYYSPYFEPRLLLMSPSSEMVHSVTLKRAFDEEGREVFSHQDQRLWNSRWETHTTWGEHGQVEQRHYSGTPLMHSSTVEWEYDEAGVLLRQAVRYANHAESNWELKVTLDEERRVVEREQISGGRLWRHESYGFVCW